MDERAVATKILNLIMRSDSTIATYDVVSPIIYFLERGSVTLQQCCTVLKQINPITNYDRFMDIIYALLLYLNPSTVTLKKCLGSNSTAKLLEARITNKFSEKYIKQNEELFRTIHSAIHSVLEQETGMSRSTEINSKLFELQKLYFWADCEKFKYDNDIVYYENPTNQFMDPLMEIFETLEKHEITNYSDAVNFLGRLKSIPIEVNAFIQYMEKQKCFKGVEIPKLVARNYHTMLQNLLKTDVESHEFMKNFKSNITKLNMDPNVYILAVDIVKDGAYRAIHEMAKWIDDMLLSEDDVRDNDVSDKSKSGESYSICLTDYNTERGKLYYTYCLRTNTTTNLTAEQIHQIGLNEVERISNEILENVKKINPSCENFADAVTYIRNLSGSVSESHIYPDNETGEAEVLNDIKLIEESIKSKLDDLFLRESLPASAFDCKYKFTPEQLKDSMNVAYYFPPSFDGAVQGAFYINLRAKLLKFELPNLFAHEAIPGHHFQLSYVAESKVHPLSKLYEPNAYIEGWALYTERICREVGLYTEPLTMIGHLMDEMMRSARLVIDTGVHHYGWDKKTALDYMNSVCPNQISSNEIEVNRYIAWPGQATAYKIGQLKMLEVRNKKISEGMSHQEFNSKLLRLGSVPLEMLDQL